MPSVDTGSERRNWFLNETWERERENQERGNTRHEKIATKGLSREREREKGTEVVAGDSAGGGAERRERRDAVVWMAERETK